MLKRNFNFYADAGHGWLEVTPADLERVGMKVSEFSNFSYKDEMQKSCIYYLEEDKDATTYINAMKAKGINVVVRHGPPRDRSPIRSFKRYEPA